MVMNAASLLLAIPLDLRDEQERLLDHLRRDRHMAGVRQVHEAVVCARSLERGREVDGLLDRHGSIVVRVHDEDRLGRGPYVTDRGSEIARLEGITRDGR